MTNAKDKAPRRDVRLAFAAALALVVQAAQPAPAQEVSPYVLGVGDVVSVTVYGRSELSGRFPVSPDGTIAFPILGNLSVAGLTPGDLGGRLDSLLAEHVPGLSVAVSVGEYAPVFIVGDVQNPGRYEYRPGMTTLELLALGGGLRRAAAAVEATQLQMIAARQDYADLELQIFAKNAAGARLRAELADSAYVQDEKAADDPDPTWQTVKARILAGEREAYEIRAAALKLEDEALLAQQKSYVDEIRQVTESVALYDREIDLLQQDVAAQRELASRGLTSKSTLREAERNLSSVRRDALENGSYLARAEQNKLAIEQKRVTLTTTRKSEAAKQLQDVELEVARMRARQKSLLETMSELALISGESAMSRVAGQPSYGILRKKDAAYAEEPGAEQTALKPGDVVRVSLPNVAPARKARLN